MMRKIIALVVCCIFMTTNVFASAFVCSENRVDALEGSRSAIAFLAPLAESLLPHDIKIERHFSTWISLVSKNLAVKEAELQSVALQSARYESLKNEILIYLRKEVAYLNTYTKSARFQAKYPDFNLVFDVDEAARKITVIHPDSSEENVLLEGQEMKEFHHPSDETQADTRIMEEASEMALAAFLQDLEHADGDIRIRGLVGIVQLIIDQRLPYKYEEMMNALRRSIVSDPSKEVQKIGRRLYPKVAYGNDTSLVHKVTINDTRTIQTALVTGGAGFLGSHLCEFLLKEGYRVLCVDNFISGKAENVAHLAKHRNFFLLKHDIIQQLDINIGIDLVFHLASLASPIIYRLRPFETTKVAVYGTLNALKIAREKGARFLFTSTSEVYGNPKVHPQVEEYRGNVNSLGERSCYDEGKRVAESIIYDFAREFSLDARIARLFNTFGPRMKTDDGRAVPQFIKQALADIPITVFGDGMQTRSLCYVDDLIQGLYTLIMADHLAPGFDPDERVVNLGNPAQEITIKFLAEEIIRLTQSKSDLVYKTLPSDDPMRRQPNIDRAKRVLGWQPRTPMTEGLRMTIEWMEEVLKNPLQKKDIETDSIMHNAYFMRDSEPREGVVDDLHSAGTIRPSIDPKRRQEEKELFVILGHLESHDSNQRIDALDALRALYETKTIPYRNESMIATLRRCIINDPDERVRHYAQTIYQKIGHDYSIQPLRTVPINGRSALRTVLVIGGAGFLGSHFCDELLAKRYRVICVDNFLTGKKENLIHLMTNPNFILIDHDINHPLQIKTPIDYVVHLASLSSPQFYATLPFEEVKVSVFGTFNALKIAFEHDAAFLFSSTSAVYGNSLEEEKETYWGNVALHGPNACYELGKRVAEAIITDSWREFKLDARIARVFMTFGPRMRLGEGRAIPTFIQQALIGNSITVAGDGLHTRCICYVSDMVNGLFAFLRKPLHDALPPEKRVINLGDPDKEFSIMELAQVIKKMVASSSVIVSTEMASGEALRRKPVVERAREYIGWSPEVGLTEGLAATIAFERELINARNGRPGTSDIDLPIYSAKTAETTPVPATQSLLTKEELAELLAPFERADNDTSYEKREVSDKRFERDIRSFVFLVYERLALKKPHISFLPFVPKEGMSPLLYNQNASEIHISYHTSVVEDDDSFAIKGVIFFNLVKHLIETRFPSDELYTRNVFAAWMSVLYLESLYAEIRRSEGERAAELLYDSMTTFFGTHTGLNQEIPYARLMQILKRGRMTEEKQVLYLERLLADDAYPLLNKAHFRKYQQSLNRLINIFRAEERESFDVAFSLLRSHISMAFDLSKEKRAIVLFEPEAVSADIVNFARDNRHIGIFIYTEEKTKFHDVDGVITVLRASESFSFLDALNGSYAFVGNKKENVRIIMRGIDDVRIAPDSDVLVFATERPLQETQSHVLVDLLVPIAASFTSANIEAVSGKDKLLERLGRVYILNEEYLHYGLFLGSLRNDLSSIVRALAVDMYQTLNVLTRERIVRSAA
jgi:nucleoside-diphosphate-sugar epimerase